MMKLLATGAKGAVGSYVEQVFGHEYDLILVDKDELDITEKADCGWIKEVNPDVVLHLAAATDVDKCELNQQWAWDTNAGGTENVTLASLNCKLVYVSTAGVFRGDKPTPYTEKDKAYPANVYGWTKKRGELMVAEHHPDYLIVRSGWMFGGGQEKDKKFVGKILNQIDAGHNDIWAVDDRFGSPTYALDLLGAIYRLLEADEFGVFHAANEGMCSRFDVAQAVVDIVGADVEVKPASSDRFPLAAPRAVSEAMESARMREVGVEPSRPWREALAEYLSDGRC